MAMIVTRCWQKTNQLQSAQGNGNKKTHKNNNKSKKQKKCCHGKGVVFIISSNPYRGFECKEPPKKIFKPKKHETVLPWQLLLPDIAKKAITHKFSCHETKPFTPILAKTCKQLDVNEQQLMVIQRARQNNIHVRQDGYNN